MALVTAAQSQVDVHASSLDTGVQTDHQAPPRSLPFKSSQFSVWDYILISVGVCLTFAVTLRFSAGRLMWEDEVLGWMLLNDPSWHHMLQSWKHGADGGGLVFYITGRLWLSSFYHSVLAFRLYTSTCFSAALVFTWIAGRRYYKPGTLAFAIGVTWFLSPVLLPHMAEGRFYGLFLASTSAVILVTLIACDRSRPSPTLLILTFAAHSFLITSHILGIAYSLCLLLVLFTVDMIRRQSKTTLYLVVFLSWLWLLPSRQAVLASAAVGRPYFWTSQPSLRVFLLLYSGESLRTACILIALGLAVVIHLGSSDRLRSAFTGLSSRLPIVLVTTSILSMPILFYVEGCFGPALCTERYLQPVEIALIFIAAELITQATWLSYALRRFHCVPLVLSSLAIAMMVIQYDLAYFVKYVPQHTDYTAQLSKALPPGVPVVCEDAFSFTELVSQGISPNIHYVYLLDWQNSISKETPRLEVTQYHLMTNWKQVGYFADHIFDRAEFLKNNKYFLVLHTDERSAESLSRKANAKGRSVLIGNPLARRFSNDPAYTELPFGQQAIDNLDEKETLVCRSSLNCADLLFQLQQDTSRDHAARLSAMR